MFFFIHEVIVQKKSVFIKLFLAENKMCNDPEKRIVDDWTNKTDFHFALNKQNRGKTHQHN